MENMEYDEKEDCYYCKNGQVLSAQYEKQEKTAATIGELSPYIKAKAAADAL